MIDFDVPWQAWVCADCNPEYGDSEWDRPFVLILRQDDARHVPDFCPRCGGHLPFTESDSKLTIGNTLAQRWAAKQAGGDD